MERIEEVKRMGSEQVIKPDLNFINDVISSGGDSLKEMEIGTLRLSQNVF